MTHHQPTLFPAFDIVEHPRARTTDPDTSHLAAEAARSLARSHDASILTTLRLEGRALAAEEVADLVSTYGGELDAVAVARRWRSLERAGAVRRTADTHRNRSGRLAARYEIVPAATRSTWPPAPAAPRHRAADDRPGDCGPPPTARQRRWRR